MKNIPIVILNRDRLEPLKLLIKSLQVRNYNNIIIIDNQTTFEPTLNWYKESNINVFYNNIHETLYDNGTFYRLAFEIKYQKFVDIVKDYYIFTDSDVIPFEEIPENFIDDMVRICSKYNLHKVGLGLKIDDLPINDVIAQKAYEIEKPYWDSRVDDQEFELYHAPIDTTFAVYSPNSPALWGDNCYRMGGKYIAKHAPWYYDINNLPEDELHYIKNLPYGRGPYYSWEIKNMI